MMKKIHKKADKIHEKIKEIGRGSVKSEDEPICDAGKQDFQAI